MKVVYEVDPNDNSYLIKRFLEASDRGDEEEADRYYRQVKFRPCILMALKKLFGADYIRDKGYNTEKADAEYGPGWLDREGDTYGWMIDLSEGKIRWKRTELRGFS